MPSQRTSRATVPRATAEQAVELLKVYQLRRENALIHQRVDELSHSLGSLKGNQASLETQTRRTAGETEFMKASLAKTNVQLKQVESNLPIPENYQQEIKCSLARLQDDWKQELNKRQDVEMYLRQIIARLEERLEQNTRDAQERSDEMADKFSKIETTLNCKVDGKDIKLLQEHIAAMRKKMCLRRHDQRSPSRVLDSIEHHIDPDPSQGNRNVSKQDDLERPRSDELRTISTEIIASDHAKRMNELSERFGTPEILDDIDLDEIAETANTVKCLVQMSSPASQVHPQPGASAFLQALLALKQTENEDAATYLRHELAQYLDVPSVAIDVLLHRLVGGILDATERKTYGEWLDEFGWTRQNLEAVIKLKAENASRIDPGQQQRAGTKITTVDMSSIAPNPSHGRHGRRPNQTEQRWIQKTDASTSAVSLRRSRRIAEKLEKRARSEAEKQSVSLSSTQPQATASNNPESRAGKRYKISKGLHQKVSDRSRTIIKQRPGNHPASKGKNSKCSAKHHTYQKKASNAEIQVTSQTIPETPQNNITKASSTFRTAPKNPDTHATQYITKGNVNPAQESSKQHKYPLSAMPCHIPKRIAITSAQGASNDKNKLSHCKLARVQSSDSRPNNHPSTAVLSSTTDDDSDDRFKAWC